MSLFVLCLHLLGCAALWVAVVPFAWQLGVTVVLLISARQTRNPVKPITLRCHQDGLLEKRVGDAWIKLELQRAPVMLPGLVLLRHKPRGKKMPAYYYITQGGMDADSWRRFCVWVKWLAVPRKVWGEEDVAEIAK